MEPNREQIEKIKKVELDILKELITVCDKLGLKYYLSEGTLLGTVRHMGFIPWDDDIDIGMVRDDYEIFVKKAPELLPEGYFVQSFETDKEYLNNFAKIRNSNTTFIETTAKNLKINHGIYIDIFPLDFITSNVKKQKRLMKKERLLRARIALGFDTDSKKMSLKTKLGRLALRVRYPSVKGAVKKRERLITSSSQKDLCISWSSAWYRKEIFPLSWFGDGEFLEFEGLKCRVPKEYDKWLTAVYGDYMQLPPEEKRVAHHFAEVIDTEKPYTEYIKA